MIKFKRKDIKWSKNTYGYHDALLKIRVPSVTTIISDMIEDVEFEEWKKSVGDKYEEILKYCADRGTSMHRMCEVFYQNVSAGKSFEEASILAKESVAIELENENIPVKCVQKGMQLFEKLYNSTVRDKLIQTKGTEIKLYSDKVFTRGALDIIYVYNGKICVSDFKTSSKYIEQGSVKEYKYKVQLGGYAVMLEDTFGDKMPISLCSIICLSTSNDENDVQEISISGEEMEKYKELFRNYAKAWHTQNNQEYVLSLT
ncbi:MAG: PD-(D/E)XK nuclease family protein [Bacteroidales bacterium]